jgi:hypothetical protein
VLGAIHASPRHLNKGIEMERDDQIELHELATIEQNLSVVQHLDSASSEGASHIQPSNSDFLMASPSGFMMASPTGFMIASASGFMMA